MRNRFITLLSQAPWTRNHPHIIHHKSAHRGFGQGDQVRIHSVTDAIAAISKTCQLVGGKSPIYQTEGEYILPIKRVIEGFRRQDPLSIPQLAVPNKVTEMAHNLSYLTGNPKLQATGDLSMITFYYILRSGEYAKPQKTKQNWKLVRATKTQEFRVQAVGFCKNRKRLSRNESMNTLIEADSAILKFSKEKKWKNGANLIPRING